MACQCKAILDKIEDMRKSLNETAVAKGTKNKESLELSHKLDRLINHFNKNCMK